MAQRVVYRRHCTYNTKSNYCRKVKTPGGRLLLQKLPKTSQRPKCGDCKRVLSGIASVRPHLYKTLKKRQRTVSRAYGGAKCHSCVKDRIIRAFLMEEQKCVKKVVKEKKQQKAVEAKKAQKAEVEKIKNKTDKKTKSKK